MILALAAIWPQPLAPVHSLAVSALVAAVPLAIVLVLMGILRTSSLLASVCGLAAAGALALCVWHMPFVLVAWSTVFGCVYAAWPILWIVFWRAVALQPHRGNGKIRSAAPLDGTAGFWAIRAFRRSSSRSASARCSKARPALARPSR